jgi:citrate synthase
VVAVSTGEPWATSLSWVTPDGVYVRGYDLVDLVDRLPFSSALYLLYTGKIPDDRTARVFDALLVASIDHGPVTPSALAARSAASGGASLQAATAAGLLAFGDHHGTAVEASLGLMTDVIREAEEAGIGLTEAAAATVQAARSEKRRIPGFGHRQHKGRDPRVATLFALADETGFSGSYIEVARNLEGALREQVGHPVPINIDGAMAAILGELRFPPNLANAVFMASRLVGVMAHAAEEIETMAPMRHIDPENYTYNGPPHRRIEGEGDE